MTTKDFINRVAANGWDNAMLGIQKDILEAGISVEGAKKVTFSEFSMTAYQFYFDDYSTEEKEARIKWKEAAYSYQDYDEELKKFQKELGVANLNELRSVIIRLTSTAKVPKSKPIEAEKVSEPEPSFVKTEFAGTPMEAKNNETVFNFILGNEVADLSNYKKTVSEKELIVKLQKYRIDQDYTFEITVRELARFMGIVVSKQDKTQTIIKKLIKKL